MATLALGAGCVITAAELVEILAGVGIVATVCAVGLYYDGKDHTLEDVKQDIAKMRGGCLKCGCRNFVWNPVSALNKAVGIFQGSGYNAEVDAYCNCTCGHHKNFHV